MISFNEKCKKIHDGIKENSLLVKEIFRVAEGKGRNLPTYPPEGTQIYFPLNKKHEGIFLGIDVKKTHYMFLQLILAKMRLLYEHSKGEVDLSRIYSGLSKKDGSLIGILSEDMSCGNKYKIEGDGENEQHWNLCKELFERDGLRRIAFEVKNKENKIIRTPLVDLDNKVKVKKKYQKEFEKYWKEYIHNEDFIIYEL